MFELNNCLIEHSDYTLNTANFTDQNMFEMLFITFKSNLIQGGNKNKLYLLKINSRVLIN